MDGHLPNHEQSRRHETTCLEYQGSPRKAASGTRRIGDYMQDSDYFLTSQEIHDKYPKGSPDYPNHQKECMCWGCYYSWSGWYEAQKGIAIAKKQLLKSSGGDLKFDQLVVACKNIGYDLTCGQCAAVFYTGWGNYPHHKGCSTVALQSDEITALRAEVQELRSINQELTFEQLANGTEK